MQVEYHGTGYQHIQKKLSTTFKDSADLVSYLNDFQRKGIKKGYLLNSIDSIKFNDQKSHVYYFVGDKLSNAQLNVSSEEVLFLKKNSRLNEKLITNVSLTPAELANTFKKTSEAYLNNGYPFVSVQLIDVEYVKKGIQAKLDIARGPLFKWSEIHIKGDSSLSVKYISNLIGIKKGDLYNEKQLKDITRKIDQLPFLNEFKSHEILFTQNGAELFLYIKSLPVSSVNGIIGFQPNPATKKLSITGDINLKLMNVLKRGELLNLRWQSIRDQTQSLNSRINYPFLFNTPFGIDGTFDLYKRDTSFLELNSTIGVQYFLNKGNYIKGYYQNINSNILSGGANNPSFSNLGTVKNNMYGLGFSSNRIDYLPNPRSGYRIYIESSAGNKKYQKNDTAQVLKDLTFRGKLELELYIPLAKRHVLRIANNTKYYSADDIFQNELFRFGGLNSQRGFNQDELNATTKSTTTLEYRFLLDRNSHVFAFGDMSWYENNAINYVNDTPYGFGLGFSFSTNLGVFSISYALGKQFNNPILFADSKIHFGYIAYF